MRPGRCSGSDDKLIHRISSTVLSVLQTPTPPRTMGPQVRGASRGQQRSAIGRSPMLWVTYHNPFPYPKERKPCLRSLRLDPPRPLVQFCWHCAASSNEAIRQPLERMLLLFTPFLGHILLKAALTSLYTRGSPQ